MDKQSKYFLLMLIIYMGFIIWSTADAYFRLTEEKPTLIKQSSYNE